jgi:hypothetical protein
MVNRAVSVLRKSHGTGIMISCHSSIYSNTATLKTGGIKEKEKRKRKKGKRYG